MTGLTRLPGEAARSSAARTRARAAALLGVLALAAGCGGSSEGFREEAEAICAGYDERIHAVASPQNLSQLVETSGEIADLLEAQTGELEELEPPEELEETWSRWLDLNEEAVANAREIQEAAGEDDDARIARLAADAQGQSLRADRLARDLGLERCMIDEDGSGSDGNDGDEVVTVGTGSDG